MLALHEKFAKPSDNCAYMTGSLMFGWREHCRRTNPIEKDGIEQR